MRKDPCYDPLSIHLRILVIISTLFLMALDVINIRDAVLVWRNNENVEDDLIN